MDKTMKQLLPLLAAASFFCLALITLAAPPIAPPANLISNGSMETAEDGIPTGFTFEGDVLHGYLGHADWDAVGRGVRMNSVQDFNKDGKKAGAFWTSVKGLDAKDGRWFRLRINAMAQDGFNVEKDNLQLRVKYFGDGGENALDGASTRVYPLIARERDDMADEGTNRTLGNGLWRFYDLVFRTPFPEVDTLKVGVSFGDGAGEGNMAEFWVDEIELVRIPPPADYQPKDGSKVVAALKDMVPIGGRFYFDPRGGDKTVPAKFDHTNSDRLLYLSDRLEAPFAQNMDSWLRPGYVDLAGKTVETARYVPDNLVITFTDTHMVMKTRNLPNHQTASFPDRWRNLDGNPNYLQEQDAEYRIPLEPKEDPDRRAMQNGQNNDRALPGGPIGVAVNGVVFFNPFDHIADADAVWRLDRCCGHPAPNKQYHYHKYPACVKSPWADDGEQASPVIGFALDGYPVYGPYEGQGQLAKDLKDNPLNEFNVHEDEARGWHYHVTPGKFPHIIGGYWGVAERRRRGGAQGDGPPGGGRRGPAAR